MCHKMFKSGVPGRGGRFELGKGLLGMFDLGL